MYIIAPLSNCGSPAKRDRFLEYISKIAPVTYTNELQCHAYAWFRSAEDCNTVPHHWLRGLEVYKSIEANTVAHRASAEYKAFRVAVGEEQLLERPSDLRFWRPLPLGFRQREGQVNFMVRDNAKSAPESRQYVVIDELTPKTGQKENVIGELRRVALQAEQEERALSFWVLHRGEEEEEEEEEEDGDLLVFMRFPDKTAWTEFAEKSETKAVSEVMSRLCTGQRRTTWVESGLGFIGRENP